MLVVDAGCNEPVGDEFDRVCPKENRTRQAPNMAC
jgi:hypothetical protein